MKRRLGCVIFAGIALAFLAAGCQQPKSEQASTLSVEDTAAIGKAIDSQIAAFVAKDIDKFMADIDPDIVNMEYDKCYRGAVEVREKHVKPEMATITMKTYKAEDRHIVGQGNFAYVNERNIWEFKDNSGKNYTSNSSWASYVLEKKSDGSWKFVQVHVSGPTL
jgi:ketosteroid isomerase-like protein